MKVQPVTNSMDHRQFQKRDNHNIFNESLKQQLEKLKLTGQQNEPRNCR